MKYADFAHQTLTEFQEIQAEFLDKYKINDFEEWFYQQATGILTLSTDENEINFKYVPIGTYSNETETFMWSWNKEDSIERNISEIYKVKDFGYQENYEKLTEGHFESDLYDGWEFIAIANKILNGIGSYRVTDEHLEIYFLLTEVVDNEKAKKMASQIVDCETHGEERQAFVCQHLNSTTKIGFEEVFPTVKGMELGEDEDFQAWCSECEKVRLSTNGWNEESMEFAKIKIVCETCYFDIKAFQLAD
jgi:hypothetical protein